MSAKLFVGNLNPQTTRSQLAVFLAPAGRVMSVVLPTERATGRPRGFAFVEFAEREGAEMAIEICDGRELDGRSLRLSWARERGEGGGERPRRGSSWRSSPVLTDDDDVAISAGREPSESRRDREGGEDEDRAQRKRPHGKHGSDRKRGRGTRRVIE